MVKEYKIEIKHPRFNDEFFGFKEIEQYFFGLTKKETLVQMHKKSLRVHQMEMGYLLNGEYTFSMNKDGNTENHPSRFSFLLDLSQEAPILLQHSSILP